MKKCFSIVPLLWIFRAPCNHGWVSWNVCTLVLHLGPWFFSGDCLTLCETGFRKSQHIVICKLRIWVDKWDICFCNWMNGIYNWTMERGNLLVKTNELPSRFARRLLQGSILCAIVIIIFLFIIILFDVIFQI